MIEGYDYNIILKDCDILFSRVNSEKLKNKSVLITGANGLIGSFLADYINFLNKKHDFNIKLYLTSYSEKQNLERIKHLINEKNVTYFKWDASCDIDAGLLPGDLDYTFFCSGYGQPAKFTKDILKTSFINTVGVNSVLKHLLKNKKTNFCFLSTSEIYGEPDTNNIPTKESYNGNYSLENPRASYICSKRLGEIICNSYKDEICVKIFRVGLIYGPGTLVSDKRVLQDFIFKAKNQKTINLLDSGQSIRNYLYLTDGVEMILNVVLNSTMQNITYNIGGEFEPVSIYELAVKVANIIKSDVTKNIDDNHIMSVTSPKNVCLSMQRYAEEFKNYGKSYTSLNEGIMNVVRWYKLI